MGKERMTLCVSHSPGFARDHEQRSGTQFRSGLDRVRALVTDFAPTLVVFFGSDHRRAFTDTIPSFAVVRQAEGLGDLLSPTGPYDVPADVADDLAAFLIGEGFDIAVTRQVALDHGFGQTAADVLGAIDAVPTLPIFINCATPPLAAPRRAAELGEAVGRFLSALEERVLVIGSGGLSHSPPTLELTTEVLPEAERKAISAAHREAAKDRIRPDWDRWFLDQLAQEDPTWVHRVQQTDIDPAGVGANEVRTWLAAYTAGGQALRTVAYEPVRDWLTGMGIAVSDHAPATA